MTKNEINIMGMTCPTDFGPDDLITLGHGSGGQLTHELLEKGIFKHLSNELLDAEHDGAIFSLEGTLAFSTDSFVVSPLFFPGGNIGELAVNGTVNDLAMCGAKPHYLSLGFLIEEGFRMSDLERIVISIAEAAAKAGVKVVTGDTKVVEKGKGDGLYINTSGIGTLHPKARISSARLQAGDKVLISGPIAAHGVAVMSLRQGLEFETDIVSDTQPLNASVWELLNNLGEDVKLLRDPTRGGLASVLNEIAWQSGKGIELIQKDLPLDNQVEGACEMLGLDPLYVANEGIFLAFVSESKADAALALLRSFDKNAAIIGELNDEYPKRVLLRNDLGGRRPVHMPTGELLPRIC